MSLKVKGCVEGGLCCVTVDVYSWWQTAGLPACDVTDVLMCHLQEKPLKCSFHQSSKKVPRSSVTSTWPSGRHPCDGTSVRPASSLICLYLLLYCSVTEEELSDWGVLFQARGRVSAAQARRDRRMESEPRVFCVTDRLRVKLHPDARGSLPNQIKVFQIDRE